MQSNQEKPGTRLQLEDTLRSLVLAQWRPQNDADLLASRLNVFRRASGNRPTMPRAGGQGAQHHSASHHASGHDRNRTHDNESRAPNAVEGKVVAESDDDSTDNAHDTDDEDNE